MSRKILAVSARKSWDPVSVLWKRKVFLSTPGSEQQKTKQSCDFEGFHGQREPLKFHTKYLTHTLKDTICILSRNFKGS